MFRSTAGRAGSAVSALALAAVLTVASGVSATAASAQDFGQHVRSCARTMGFSGEHNPGMHHGLHGWDVEHLC